jgi:membrane protease YdiL (CAAX protease family)
MMVVQALTSKIGSTENRRIGAALLAGYLVLYAATLVAMHRKANFDVTEPLLVLGIVGIGFSAAAWLLTIGVKPLAYSVRQPRKELTVIAAYLIPVVAFLTWGLGAIHRYIPADPADAWALLIAKLVVFVVVPTVIMRSLFDYRFRQLAPMSMRPRQMLVTSAMSVLLLGFQAVLGSGLSDIGHAHMAATKLAIGVPFIFIWLALEAGVVEEFFFRVLLQARLSAVLRSELGGIVLMALLFGLAHAPGLYLRSALTHEGLGSHPSFLLAVGYSIVVTSVAGFFLGSLWARTRNFAAVVLIHAAGDLLPNFLPMLHSLHAVK